MLLTKQQSLISLQKGLAIIYNILLYHFPGPHINTPYINTVQFKSILPLGSNVGAFYVNVISIFHLPVVTFLKREVVS